jgi:hypothetical protein
MPVHCLVHCFEVSEFKSRFGFDCLSVFKNLKPFSSLPLNPIPILARFCFLAQTA